MPKRRTHSSIERLPAPLRDTLTRMLVDNEWPADWPLSRIGTPRYEDLAAYCVQKGYNVSESAIGRFGMRMRTLSRMKQAGIITREVMADITNEKASQTQKAVAEMLTAVAIEFVSEHQNFGADEIRDVAKAIKDCTAIAINSDKYVREQLEKKINAADKTISALAARKHISPEVLKIIKEQVYGIMN